MDPFLENTLQIEATDGTITNVYFNADDAVHGRELFRFPNGATAQAIGRGCGPELRATDPLLGQTMSFSGAGAPTRSHAITIIGAPTVEYPIGGGCFGYIDLSVFFAAASVPLITRTKWTSTLGIPNDKALQGVTVNLQTWYLALGASNGSIVTSNAVELTLGSW